MPDVEPPMTSGQVKLLQALAFEAYQPQLFAKGLSQQEAAKRIKILRIEIELANSF